MHILDLSKSKYLPRRRLILMRHHRNRQTIPWQVGSHGGKTKVGAVVRLLAAMEEVKVVVAVMGKAEVIGMLVIGFERRWCAGFWCSG